MPPVTYIQESAAPPQAAVLLRPLTPEVLCNEEIIPAQQGGTAVKYELPVSKQTYVWI